ncbi:M23 family metallopeptidase [Tumidithrix elongata RA019]|uniref:M23 family metallopeptidase n=1 Tax=Tumidithrix elongata BACA0141 TaxID=2716417 RepID=A0AAW9Q175_9CYAN|nr:M23 family metallopeptidase [Tumidithrix elongata RA019]
MISSFLEGKATDINKAIGAALLVAMPLLSSGGLAQGASANPKMPFQGSASTSQGTHNDGYGLKAVDFRLPAGTPVLAPENAVVISTCNAGNNHRAIKLRAGTRYFSLIHVNTANIYVGKTYLQGQMIGTVAGDRPWNNCAKSTGAHLHFGVSPSSPVVDGVNIANLRVGTVLRSTNYRR